jgi:hypothetical protein
MVAKIGESRESCAPAHPGIDRNSTTFAFHGQ